MMFNFSNHKDLIIFDDYFPNLLTGFRIAEYNYYLECFKNSEVYSTHPDFTNLKQQYTEFYPEFQNKIKEYQENTKYQAKLFYTVFLNNIYKFLPVIEQSKTPFVFTLYPGGGFLLNHDVEADDHLQKVISSPYFKKVIVTQKVTKDYLLQNNFCRADQIKFIFGVVTDSDYVNENVFPKKLFKKDKSSFDICFVAHKYMPKGKDKGYDRFISIAKSLANISDDFKFHVVGGFDTNDIDVTTLKDRIIFYGSQDKSFFPEFYSNMDIILSPVTPFISYPGAFDGFPTTCCTDAALCGTAVFTTDPLEQNTTFRNGVDIVLVPPDNNVIEKKILHYFSNLEDLYSLSLRGQKVFSDVYRLDNQMAPRLQVLKDALRSR